MLTGEELIRLAERLELSEEAIAVMNNVRVSEPSRRVSGRAGNVCVRYASHKMMRTINAESHRNELAYIYVCEHDKNTLEFYDQPPAIKIEYKKNGRKVGTLYTPDFFIIRKDGVGWVECKMEEELKRLEEENPNRYTKGEDGRWHCLPAEKYAEQFGFFFEVRSSAEIDWVYQRNMRFLEDYLLLENPTLKSEASDEILSLVAAEPGVALDRLLASLKCATSDDVYTMVAMERIYVDMRSASLAEADRVRIFRDREIAQAYVVLSREAMQRDYDVCHPILVAVNAPVMWDGKAWIIINDGEKNVSLLASDGSVVEFPRSTFDTLVKRGRLTGPPAYPKTSLHEDEVRKILIAHEGNLEKALYQHSIVKAHLEGSLPDDDSTPSRTIREWKAKFRKSEKLCGNGFVGLLNRSNERGNRMPKLDKSTADFTNVYISDHYETFKQQTIIAVFRELEAACKLKGVLAPSYKTFALKVKARDLYQQKRKRKGDKAAYGDKPFYWELDVTTPRHCDRPFEGTHIDHTQLDIELVDARTGQNLGRPWVTFLVDSYSRRVLAVYLTFDPPSYRSCMMVLRVCVKRHGRLPQSIVVDGGKEFSSVYFESLLALNECSIHKRPWAEPHYGSVSERLFGTANTTFVYNLEGNTQIMKNVRQVTKEVNPKGLACETLNDLYQKLCEWAYEGYDKEDHFTLGQSPHMAFELGLKFGGARDFKRIPYDEAFRFMTLPTTQKKTAKVQVDGVKINYVHYWCDAFRSPTVQGLQVRVRYDPFDMGIAYAFVKGQWIQCISEYRAVFKGRSEREVDIATKVLRKRNQDSAKKNVTVSSSQIAVLLTSLNPPPEMLLQRMHDIEAEGILTGINEWEGGSTKQSFASQSNEKFEDMDDSESPEDAEIKDEQTHENVREFYEDF